jgi:peptide/nickel transport system permease protein
MMHNKNSAFLPKPLIRGATFLLFVLVFADFLANDKPILCHCNGSWKMPVLQKQRTADTFDREKCSLILFPVIRYNPYQIDTKIGRLTSPFDQQNEKPIGERHWLGTDKIGRDVAAGIIHGAGISLWIAICTTLFGLLLGLPYGIILGYFQDRGIQWNSVQMIMVPFFLFMLFFYGMYLDFSTIGLLVFIFLLVFLMMISIFLAGKLPLRKYPVPADLIGFRILEWRKSIPGLFLLLALLSLFSKPSSFHVIFIIGLLSWADIARMVRAETLSVKSKLYVQSGIAMGFSHFYLILKYILPGLKNTLVVIAMYMMAGAVLMEATLSFLGLGLPVEEVSWGKMLAESRNAGAWWLAVFPGLCLMSLLYWLHKWSKVSY